MTKLIPGLVSKGCDHPKIAKDGPSLLNFLRAVQWEQAQKGVKAACGDLEHIVQARIPGVMTLFPGIAPDAAETIARYHTLFELYMTALQQANDKIIQQGVTEELAARQEIRKSLFRKGNKT